MSAIARRWQRLSLRIEALGQRERVLCFAAAAALLVFAVQAGVLGPLARKQALLQTRSAQQSDRVATINDDIARLLAAAAADPDQLVRDRLGAVRADTQRLGEELRTMQKGLVAPESIAPLLESILRANGRLQLVSLRTLAVDTVDGASPDAAKPAVADAASAAGAPAKASAAVGTVLYRHGVELTVRGSYLDMVDYMTALQSLPTQLFWGKAELQVEQYPAGRLTLTLYTLSLDPKWMKL